MRREGQIRQEVITIIDKEAEVATMTEGVVEVAEEAIKTTVSNELTMSRLENSRKKPKNSQRRELLRRMRHKRSD